MSGIPIHTQDPIHPTVAKGAISRAKDGADGARTSTTMSTNVQRYGPSKTGAAGPSPTRTTAIDQAIPPPPQPRAVPVPTSAIPPVRAPIAPPPKLGEKAMAPEYYKPPNSAPKYPVRQASRPSKFPILAATTMPTLSTDVGSTPEGPNQIEHPSSHAADRSHLEHPPGYLQNPYASDMTPDQRFATEREERGSATELPVPSTASKSSYDVEGASSPLDEALEIWNSTKKWVAQRGEAVAGQLSDMHRKAWDAIEGEK